MLSGVCQPTRTDCSHLRVCPHYRITESHFPFLMSACHKGEQPHQASCWVLWEVLKCLLYTQVLDACGTQTFEGTLRLHNAKLCHPIKIFTVYCERICLSLLRILGRKGNESSNSFK